MEFAVVADHKRKLKENENEDKYVDLTRELKKKKQTIEHESDNYTNCDCCFWHGHKTIIKETGGLGDHPNYNIIENDQNTEKSPADLKSQKLQWKTINRLWNEKLSRSKWHENIPTTGYKSNRTILD